MVVTRISSWVGLGIASLTIVKTLLLYLGLKFVTFRLDQIVTIRVIFVTFRVVVTFSGDTIFVNWPQSPCSKSKKSKSPYSCTVVSNVPLLFIYLFIQLF